MGDARRRLQANGGILPPPNRRIRVVRDLRLENVEADRVTILTLGEREPEIAAALSVDDSRKLAAALTAHADALEKAMPRIIVPGGIVHA